MMKIINSGIYKITIHNKFYIGSALNLKNRYYIHISLLKRGIHKNPILQNLFNKYGWNINNFETIELCEPSKLIEREQYYIDTLKPTININLIAGNSLGRKFSAKTIEKMRLAQEKKIYQYSLDGTLIKEWKSAKVASEFYKIDYTGILKCCAGIFKGFQGYIWSFNKQDKVKPYRNGHQRQVAQYDSSWNKINTFNSIKEAGIALGVKPNFISRVCSKKKGRVKGFYFTYYEAVI